MTMAKASYTMYRKKNNFGKYFWQAEVRVNRKLRRKYIGYKLPDRAKLAELAELFSLSDTEYYKCAIAKNKNKKSE